MELSKIETEDYFDTQGSPFEEAGQNRCSRNKYLLDTAEKAIKRSEHLLLQIRETRAKLGY